MASTLAAGIFTMAEDSAVKKLLDQGGHEA